MMSRLSPFSLVIGNIARKPFRTFILSSLVAVFCMAMFAGTVIGLKISTGTQLAADRLGADILFVPYGYEKSVQSSLLRGEPSSFYMDRGLVGELRGEKGVLRVTEQLFLATLKASCCSYPVQIIGFNPKTDFVVTPWMNQSLNRAMNENEVVAGCKISGNPGETIRLFGREFSIAAKLDPTGMGFDTSVFMEVDRARRLLLDSELGLLLRIPEGLDKSTFISSVLVKAEPGTDVTSLVNGLSEKYAIRYNLDFTAIADMISSISSKLSVFASVFRMFSAAVWVLAVMILAFVFTIILQERKKEFGILRIVGASKGHVRRLFVGEALLTSCMGAFCGVVLAALALGLFHTYIDVTLNLPRIGIGFGKTLLIGAGVFVMGLVTGPLACLPLLRKLGSIDSYLIMKEGE